MSGTEDLTWHEENGIGIITLNRPQARNALTFEMYARLREICEGVDPDGSLRAIVITGSRESDLARAADIVLHVPIEREACPLNLTPTTSTTAALAMGDALAVALLVKRANAARMDLPTVPFGPRPVDPGLLEAVQKGPGDPGDDDDRARRPAGDLGQGTEPHDGGDRAQHRRRRKMGLEDLAHRCANLRRGEHDRLVPGGHHRLEGHELDQGLVAAGVDAAHGRADLGVVEGAHLEAGLLQHALRRRGAVAEVGRLTGEAAAVARVVHVLAAPEVRRVGGPRVGGQDLRQVAVLVVAEDEGRRTRRGRLR